MINVRNNNNCNKRNNLTRYNDIYWLLTYMTEVKMRLGIFITNKSWADFSQINPFLPS